MTAPDIANLPIPVAPSKPVERGASTTGSQRDRRFTDTFFDTYRHARFPNGRPFTGQREFQSGSSTESIAAGFLQSDLQCGEYFCERPEMGQTPQERARTLASVWSAPWLPIGGKKYMQFNYRRKIITFDYARGENDERLALRTYYLGAAKLAAANGWGEIKPGLVPSYQVTAVVGEPPKFLPVWQAARAGDPWLMGAVDEPNERLAKILGFTEPQYFGAPMDFGDASFVSVPTPKAPEPLVSAEKILSVPVEQVQALIEAALAKRDAEEKAAKKAIADRLKAGRDKKKAAKGAAA